MSDQPPKPFQFSRRKLLGFVAVVSVVCALASLVSRAQEAARRQTCVNNLKVIGRALLYYHDIYDCFPTPFNTDASGKPLHSWRVAIQFYLTSSNFDSIFNRYLPWDNPSNLKASAPWSHWFQCPSARHPAGSGFTNYVMVVGQKRAAGSGTKEAIIVVEIADSDIHWTEPRDLNFDEMSFKINDKSKPSVSSHHVHGAMVLYADGGVHFLDESTDPDELQKLLTENLEDGLGAGEEERVGRP